MQSTKFVGMDVHKEAITVAVMDSAGKLIMESVIETKALTILQFIQGLRGEVYVAFEEGTWAAWGRQRQSRPAHRPLRGRGASQPTFQRWQHTGPLCRTGNPSGSAASKRECLDLEG